METETMKQHPDFGLIDGAEVVSDLSFDPREAPGATRIEKLRAIVEQRTCMTVEGQPVDLFSANTVVQLHDALRPENRERLMGRKTVLSVVKTAFDVIQKASAR